MKESSRPSSVITMDTGATGASTRSFDSTPCNRSAMNRNGRFTERWTKLVKPAGVGRGMTRVRSTEAKMPSTMTAPMMPSSTRTAIPFLRAYPLVPPALRP
ncbi:hypothetical protein ACIG63_23675 [Streptomyces antimycoticus]|uniref:hypothetical protein n=1 Tax=Streptomyces antimycoticus TaxID=68175 RepID=UPI00341053B1